MFDGEAFGQQMVEIVRGYVAAEIAPLKEENATLRAENKALADRLDALESRGLPEAIKGDPGEVDMVAVREIVDQMTQQAVSEQLVEAVKTIPLPQAPEPIAPDMDAIEKMIRQNVAEVVASQPPPQPGKDGVGLSDALIDKDGNLVLTMTDGRIRELGRVIGKDGKDGAPGKDGHTFTLDDFDVEPLDERSIIIGFTHGDTKHSFELEFPIPIYRHVWKDGETYARGDLVTWGGSLWHCDEHKGLKPDAPESGWTLAVKRGRDGKDGGR